MKVLITGATGFLGFQTVKYLKARGYTVFATGRNPAMAEQLDYLDVPCRKGDVSDKTFVEDLLKGMDAVVHTAGLSSPWGPYAAFYEANVVGTENIVQGCLSQGVPRLVHISTPSLYVRNQHCLNVRESDPLPEAPINDYARTKGLAEDAVHKGIEAGLKAVMLRPRAIVGEGDTVIMPRLLRGHAEGRLRVIGDGRNQVDMTPVQNVCHAIELGLKAEGAALGEAYNISNGEPVRLWDAVAEVFERLDLQLNRRKLPFAVAYAIAAGLELAAKSQPGQPEPPLTRYSVIMLARSQTLNIDKARELLGYVPQKSLSEAMEDFGAWWKQKHWC